VLINGETETGQELIAQAIHKCSNRSNGLFVKVNCAAIPAGLLESELFGHELGAYTSGFARGTGRLERANGGILFLDEVGDLPLELQPKLLRITQEKQVERLGGTATIHTDVRIICATYRNLVEMVDEGQFRADLFYRLSVFPIELPPLRDRREDIGLLVDHFAVDYAACLLKRITVISDEFMSVARHSWTQRHQIVANPSLPQTSHKRCSGSAHPASPRPPRSMPHFHHYQRACRDQSNNDHLVKRDISRRRENTEAKYRVRSLERFAVRRRAFVAKARSRF
jgi:Mg-chelatase subunit ChlI